MVFIATFVSLNPGDFKILMIMEDDASWPDMKVFEAQRRAPVLKRGNMLQDSTRVGISENCH